MLKKDVFLLSFFLKRGRESVFIVVGLRLRLAWQQLIKICPLSYWAQSKYDIKYFNFRWKQLFFSVGVFPITENVCFLITGFSRKLLTGVLTLRDYPDWWKCLFFVSGVILIITFWCFDSLGLFRLLKVFVFCHQGYSKVYKIKKTLLKCLCSF